MNSILTVNLVDNNYTNTRSDVFTENTVGEGDAEARLVIGKRHTCLRHAVIMVRLVVRWRRAMRTTSNLGERTILFEF